MEETVETALGAAFPGRPIDRTFEVGPSWNGANETVGVAFADGAPRLLQGRRRGRREPDRPRTGRASVPRRGATDFGSRGTGRRPGRVGAVPRHRAGAGSRTARRLGGGGEEQREALLRRVGATLATLHAERFETHGEIVGGSDTGETGSRSESALILDPAPWPDVLRATIERTREIGTSERLADHYDAVFDCVEANRDRLGGAPAALLHGDVAKPNLFVDDGGVS